MKSGPFALPESTVGLYIELMEEIKRRTDVVRKALNGEVPLPRIVIIELCYVQFRFICELIALSCLTAHGDVPGAKAKRLTKSYQTDAILHALEDLHPSFFSTAKSANQKR